MFSVRQCIGRLLSLSDKQKTVEYNLFVLSDLFKRRHVSCHDRKRIGVNSFNCVEFHLVGQVLGFRVLALCRMTHCRSLMKHLNKTEPFYF